MIHKFKCVLILANNVQEVLACPLNQAHVRVIEIPDNISVDNKGPGEDATYFSQNC